MSSTIDNINSNVINKLHLLSKIILIYNDFDIEEADIMKLKKNYVILDNLEVEYGMGTVNILINFYTAKSKTEKKKYYKSFTNFIIRNNILGKIDRVYRSLEVFKKNYSINGGVSGLFSDYNFISISIDKSHNIDNICECGHELSIESKTSEFYCEKCGACSKLYGAVFEDDQFWLQEGQRSKHGKYDSTNHCKQWLDKIQANENTEIPTKVINVIKKCIRRDKIWIDQLDCSTIRKYLKSNKLSKYNINIPLIRKIISGKEPEQLTDKELQMTYRYFSEVMQIYTKVKPDDKPNSPYHPFFIIKILENIIDVQDKKNDILSCIHFQSRETLIENDRIWKLICEHIEEFKYTPTESV